jgi:hypothetical protein
MVAPNITKQSGVVQSTELEGQFNNVLRWEDIDHTKTLSIGDSGQTSIVYRENANDVCCVLKSCSLMDYSQECEAMARIAQRDSEGPLLFTKCIFNFDGRCFVGSELSGVSLAEIIDCTIYLKEVHLSTILQQVYQDALSFRDQC